MELKVRGTAKLSKAFAVKREKDAQENERVIAHLKVKGLFTRRDDFDELAGLPTGWCAPWYRENGEPELHMSVLLIRRVLYFTGKIELHRSEPDSESPAPLPALSLTKATFTDIRFSLDKLGGIVSAQIAWPAAGDEVEDVGDLLGQACLLEGTLVDWVREGSDGQTDMVPPVPQARRSPIAQNARRESGRTRVVTFADRSAEAMEQNESSIIHGAPGTPAVPPPDSLTHEKLPPRRAKRARPAAKKKRAAGGRKSESSKQNVSGR